MTILRRDGLAGALRIGASTTVNQLDTARLTNLA